MYNFNNIKAAVFDLDGTIYFGSQLAYMANDVIKKAREKFKNILFVTNNSAKSRMQIYEKLKKMGTDAELSELYTVSYIIPQYLKENNYKEVFCIGTEDLKNEIRQNDINPVSKTPQAIVTGFNPDFALKDLNELANIKIDKSCKLIVANKERIYPVENGYLNAGAAPIVGAVENLLDKKTDIIIGKPNTEMLRIPLCRLDIDAEEVILIGDSYESDIVMANNYGAQGILITKEPKNDCICIKQLADLLEII